MPNSAMITLDFTLKAAKPVSPAKLASPARHFDSTVRAVDAVRDLIVALHLCEKALNRVRSEVDDEAYPLVSKMSEHLYCVRELAKQLQRQVDLCAQERAAFWNRQRVDEKLG